MLYIISLYFYYLSIYAKAQKKFTHHKPCRQIRQSQNIHIIVADRMAEKYKNVSNSWRLKDENHKILYHQPHKITILTLKNIILD